MLTLILLEVFELIEDDLLDYAEEKLELWDVEATASRVDDAVRDVLLKRVRSMIARRKQMLPDTSPPLRRV